MRKEWNQMQAFHEINPQQITENPFTLIGNDWMLITAQKPDGTFNTMTASWGGVGIMSVSYTHLHDITDIFIDAALRICQNDMEAFKCFIKEVDCFSEKNGFQVTMTSSIPFDTADSEIKSYVTNLPQ